MLLLPFLAPNPRLLILPLKMHRILPLCQVFRVSKVPHRERIHLISGIEQFTCSISSTSLRNTKNFLGIMCALKSLFLWWILTFFYTSFVPIREAMENASINLNAIVVDRLGIRSNIFSFVVLGAFHRFRYLYKLFFPFQEEFPCLQIIMLCSS
jgi:hypothetical protein